MRRRRCKKERKALKESCVYLNTEYVQVGKEGGKGCGGKGKERGRVGGKDLQNIWGGGGGRGGRGGRDHTGLYSGIDNIILHFLMSV